MLTAKDVWEDIGEKALRMESSLPGEGTGESTMTLLMAVYQLNHHFDNPAAQEIANEVLRLLLPMCEHRAQFLNEKIREAK